jgi:2,5-dihydroxypyridine 5,6-dioxygenase
MAFPIKFPHLGKSIDMTKLFYKELKLCKIKEGDSVAVFTDTRMDTSYPDAWMTACNLMDAEVFEAKVLYSSMTGTGSTARQGPMGIILEALKKADMVVDITTNIWLYTRSTSDILEAGGRILMVMSPEETLNLLFPTDAHIRRTYNGAKMFEKGEEIRVTSPVGTDFTCSKKGRKGTAQVGIVDKPGRWDNFGSGLIGCAPLEDSVNGTLVIDVGEPYFGAGTVAQASDQTKLTLEDGKITKIEGKADARTLESWFARWNNEQSYVIAHVCIGTHENARWDAGIRMHWESYLGGMLIAFGANFFSSPERYCGLGGKNNAPSHLDIALRNCSLYLDGEKILENGKFVHPELV